MKHAYLILAHKNTTQLVQLISALQSENGYFFVHIDGKSENVYDAGKPGLNIRVFLQLMILIK
ncbi:hypothetical protein FACS1894160_3190 [Bacteroidia bacterium]|nr:hypothetical protein FACS1894123_05360 [Bacteroidia bacterium]GHV08609.1 hypothetical protein FACS1894160_3190 [Bacteroidia bacterium]